MVDKAHDEVLNYLQRKYETNMIHHTIISEDDISYANVKRLALRVRMDVDAIPSESAINDLVSVLTADVPEDCDDYSIFGYLPGMDTDGPAYVIADWKPGITSFRTSPLALVGTKWEET